jgi:DNA-binding CsgD family transcriptional regulator
LFVFVFYELKEIKVIILGSSYSVFVREFFLRELKTPPYFWTGPELVSRLTQGDSPVLSDKEVREANSSGGLNLVIWQMGVRPEDLRRTEAGNVVMTAFIESYRGFLLNEFIVQAESTEHFHGIRKAGGLYLNRADGHYGDFPDDHVCDVVMEPHIVGLTRESALNLLGSWVASLFLYQAPRFGLSRSEQRLLLSASDGGTDDKLADKLGISLSAVKKTWRMVYDRIGLCLPALIPGDLNEDMRPSDRGKEKKRHLISYLREHPEELRPVSRKLLQPRAQPPNIHFRRHDQV